MSLFTPINFEIAKLVQKAKPKSGRPMDRLLIAPEFTFVTDGVFCVKVSSSRFSAADYPTTPLGAPLSRFPPFMADAKSAADFHRRLPKRKSTIPILDTIGVFEDSSSHGSLLWTDLDKVETLPLPGYRSPDPSWAVYPDPQLITEVLSSYSAAVPGLTLDCSLLHPIPRLAAQFGGRDPYADFHYLSFPPDPESDFPPSAALHLSLKNDDGQTFDAWLANAPRR